MTQITQIQYKFNVAKFLKLTAFVFFITCPIMIFNYHLEYGAFNFIQLLMNDHNAQITVGMPLLGASFFWTLSMFFKSSASKNLHAYKDEQRKRALRKKNALFSKQNAMR